MKSSEESLGGWQIPLDLPDLWQQDAIRALKAGADVIVDAPTGAGKTRIFELFIEGRRNQSSGQAVYTVPTRALANDKWAEWKARGWNVGIATGDIAENLHAPILVATLETQRERILEGNSPRLLVIDEYQMLADAKRGLNYELAIALSAPTTQLLLLSGSVRNPEEVAAWLRRLERTVELTRITERPVPLDEVPIERLPRVRGVEGYWQQLAAGAVIANLTPLLIFAPRRAEVEKIARKVAEGLTGEIRAAIPPDADSIMGRDVAGLLRRGVGVHHSGLPYRARADFIEPLAKAGKLPIIVATTGLAAGINFSVRSVLIAGTSYQEGPFTRELRPDEMLQMFGRAGRRGLDESGYVFVTHESPRLRDGSPRDVRRVNQIDWPTLLRIMEAAEENGENGLEKAQLASRRLFSRQVVPLGLETSSSDVSPEDRFGPMREEFLNSRGEWEPTRSAVIEETALSECWVRHGEQWRPARRSAATMEKIGPGRLCKITDSAGFHYAKELIVGLIREGSLVQPLPWVRKSLHLSVNETFTETAFSDSVVPLLMGTFEGGVPIHLVPRGETLALQLEFGHRMRKSIRDTHGRRLLDPPKRKVSLSNEIGYKRTGEPDFNPPRGSAARAWRALGLVDENGKTTARGRIVSRFQAGEGMMLAAAMEDSNYDLAALVRHLANLRGGNRFGDFSGESERLAHASRQAFGHTDYEGYLSAGVGETYGEGTCEAIELFHQKGMRPFAETLIRRGDLERASVEWLSLLRHVVHAPNPDVERWPEFQQRAATVLAANH